MTFPYSQQNTESGRRLETLVRGLTDADLDCTTDYHWTVAALLAHLAFWDHRMSVILNRWQTEGLNPSEIDSTAVNDSLKVICHALVPRVAAELALVAAEKIDSELEVLTPERVQATSTQYRMNRSLHRESHLKDIEALISK